MVPSPDDLSSSRRRYLPAEYAEIYIYILYVVYRYHRIITIIISNYGYTGTAFFTVPISSEGAHNTAIL